MLKLTWSEVFSRLQSVGRLLHRDFGKNEGTLYIWGLPRGGAIVAGLLASHYPAYFVAVDEPEAAMIIVDDIIDTGRTHRDLLAKHHKPVAYLVNKESEGIAPTTWVLFPWEIEEEELEAAKRHPRDG
jgi:hypoxanthine phosphoribosyltransferase